MDVEEFLSITTHDPDRSGGPRVVIRDEGGLVDIVEVPQGRLDEAVMVTFSARSGNRVTFAT